MKTNNKSDYSMLMALIRNAMLRNTTAIRLSERRSTNGINRRGHKTAQGLATKTARTRKRNTDSVSGMSPGVGQNNQAETLSPGASGSE